jgi:hypothetical protein
MRRGVSVLREGDPHANISNFREYSSHTHMIHRSDSLQTHSQLQHHSHIHQGRPTAHCVHSRGSLRSLDGTQTQLRPVNPKFRKVDTCTPTLSTHSGVFSRRGEGGDMPFRHWRMSHRHRCCRQTKTGGPFQSASLRTSMPRLSRAQRLRRRPARTASASPGCASSRAQARVAA